MCISNYLKTLIESVKIHAVELFNVIRKNENTFFEISVFVLLIHSLLVK